MPKYFSIHVDVTSKTDDMKSSMKKDVKSTTREKVDTDRKGKRKAKDANKKESLPKVICTIYICNGNSALASCVTRNASLRTKTKKKVVQRYICNLYNLHYENLTLSSCVTRNANVRTQTKRKTLPRYSNLYKFLCCNILKCVAIMSTTCTCTLDLYIVHKAQEER